MDSVGSGNATFFGHYCLFRSLQPLLSASKSPLGARVLWTSSMEASPTAYQPDDWQLINTEYSYGAVKYQIDLIATYLDSIAIEESPRGAAVKVRHVVVQPGIAGTNISSALGGWFTEILKILTFYIGRMLNSPHHTIHIYTAAISAVHLSLISLSFIPAFLKSTTNGTANSHAKKLQPMRFGSETDRWGNERVGLTPVLEWDVHEQHGKELLQKCDKLYQQCQENEGIKNSVQ